MKHTKTLYHYYIGDYDTEERWGLVWPLTYQGQLVTDVELLDTFQVTDDEVTFLKKIGVLSDEEE